jgi:IS66 Orf2 like protein
MLQVASGTKVHLALRPLSMRYGFDGLSARVASILQQDPFSGHLFLFRSKRGDYLKILHWDGSGLCLFACPQGDAKHQAAGEGPLYLATDCRWGTADHTRPVGVVAGGDRLAADGAAGSASATDSRLRYCSTACIQGIFWPRGVTSANQRHVARHRRTAVRSRGPTGIRGTATG